MDLFGSDAASMQMAQNLELHKRW